MVGGLVDVTTLADELVGQVVESVIVASEVDSSVGGGAAVVVTAEE